MGSWVGMRSWVDMGSWVGMGSWGGTKHCVLCSGYNAPTDLFRNLQKRSLSFMERDTLQAGYPL